jgi:hypothetical protein
MGSIRYRQWPLQLIENKRPRYRHFLQLGNGNPELVGIHVRDVFKHVENGAPRALLDIHMATAETEEKARSCASLAGLRAHRLPPLQLKQQQHIQ